MPFQTYKCEGCSPFQGKTGHLCGGSPIITLGAGSSLTCRAALPPHGTACNYSPRGNLGSKAGRETWRGRALFEPCFLPYAFWPLCLREKADQILTPTRPLRNNHLYRQEPKSTTKLIPEMILKVQAWEEVLFRLW